MSTRAMNWAFAVIPLVDLKPSEALTLLALAHCHFEDTGRCSPSNAYLRKKTGLSERAVRDAIGSLAEKGIVSVVYRQVKTGAGKRNFNNRYAFRGGAKSAGGMGQNLPPLMDRKAMPRAWDSLIHGGVVLEEATDLHDDHA